MLQRHLRERDPAGQAPVEHTLRDGRHTGYGLGGDGAHVLQLLSEQTVQGGRIVHVSHTAGVRGVGRQLFRPVLPDHRPEIHRGLQAENDRDAGAILSVLEQRVRRLGLLRQPQDFGGAQAKSDLRRTAFVFDRRPAETRQPEPRRTPRQRHGRPDAHIGPGVRHDRGSQFLRVHDVLLFHQVTATRAIVLVGVPVGVLHARGHNVLQHRVANRFRYFFEIREPFHVPREPHLHTQNNIRQTVTVGGTTGLRLQTHPLRPGKIAVLQRAV